MNKNQSSNYVLLARVPCQLYTYSESKGMQMGIPCAWKAKKSTEIATFIWNKGDAKSKTIKPKNGMT